MDRMTIDGTIKLRGKYEYIKSNPVSNVYRGRGGRMYYIHNCHVEMGNSLVNSIYREDLVGTGKVMIKTIKGERGRKRGQ
jgi:hypothetical protein